MHEKGASKVHNLHLGTCAVLDYSMLNRISKRKTSSNRHKKVTSLLGGTIQNTSNY